MINKSETERSFMEIFESVSPERQREFLDFCNELLSPEGVNLDNWPEYKAYLEEKEPDLLQQFGNQEKII